MLVPNLTVDQFISKLYRGASHVSSEDFQPWALDLLRRVIDFDAAIWGSGHVSHPVFQTQSCLDVSPTLFDDLQKSIDINPMYNALMNNKGAAINMADVIADEDFYQSDIYYQCFQPHGIERILSSIHLDEPSGIFTLLTLYRFDRNNRFSQQEKAEQQTLLFHLLSAAQHCQFLTLKGAMLENKSTSGELFSLCDKTGIYHAVEPRFVDLMREVFPHANSQKLPIEINDNEIKSPMSGLFFKITPVGDLYRVSARYQEKLDKLTEREQQVVAGICQGSTFKQIARDLSLSPSTVSNHLYRIYLKLGINTRSELVKLVHDTQSV